MNIITKDAFLKKYQEHQEWLIYNTKGNRLVWDFKINFKFSFDFVLNLSYADLGSADLSYADLSYANLSSANLGSANLSYANLGSANLDYSSWPLSCKTKEVILCLKLQAQLLGHVMNVATDVKFSKEQVQFVKDNWPRFDEFCNDEIKGLLE